MKALGTTAAGTHLLEFDESEVQALTALVAAAAMFSWGEKRPAGAGAVADAEPKVGVAAPEVGGPVARRKVESPGADGRKAAGVSVRRGGGMKALRFGAGETKVLRFGAGETKVLRFGAGEKTAAAKEPEPDRVCPGCGEMFAPPRTAPGARYCREPDCQRAMKVEYQRKYRAKAAKAGGSGPPADSLRSPTPAHAPQGADRVRAIQRRIQVREIAEGGLPHDPLTGQALRVGIEE